MKEPTYAVPADGLPAQGEILTGSAVFTDCYAVIPRAVMREIVTSVLPGFSGARAWILARPLTGFAETFAQYIVELAPGGGSCAPEPDPLGEAVIFVTEGTLTLAIGAQSHRLAPGGYAYLPAGADWSLGNEGGARAVFHWIRKAYEDVAGVPRPAAFVTNERDVAPDPMPGSEGAWATTRFVDSTDPGFDMHVNIVTFQPGGAIPFEETHVMEHGISVLAGRALYKLNRDWVEVGAGDFLWLRAFCPQACIAGGPGPFRYLLYKDVNRHPALRLK